MSTKTTKHFKVAILGGGITGSAIFYTLSKYTNIDSIALVEKCSGLGQINSRGNNNSQTLHFGDIETNYKLEKAAKTKEASEMVVRLLEDICKDDKNIYTRSHKLALAVGTDEVAELKKRYEEFKKLFPELRLIDKSEIERLEPEIVKGRASTEDLAAFYSEKSYVVNFGGLAEALAKNATKHSKSAEILLNSNVENISKTGNLYSITTSSTFFTADVVIVSMCAHSLMFAKQLGYGADLALLPVGGNFYTSSRKVLNGKVYTMQSGKLPFAAVHGDPNLEDENTTRFGPTANVMPFLERNNLKTFWDFHKTSTNNLASVLAITKVILDPTLFSFLFNSLAYELPYFGPRSFAKLATKIIPSISYNDFKSGKTKAGIRPQLIDVKNNKLLMGETEIIGDNILFQVTPSPGATACLYNARISTKKIIDFFAGEYAFDESQFNIDLVK